MSFAANEHYFRLRDLSITKAPFRKKSDVKPPMSLCDGNSIYKGNKKREKKRRSVLIHVRYCTNLLSVTTNLPTKHPQGKVELCHQFPQKNSPPALGKNEGSASSVLSYLSCAHIKKEGPEQQHAKNKSGKHEWKAGECDVTLSVIHAFTLCS